MITGIFIFQGTIQGTLSPDYMILFRFLGGLRISKHYQSYFTFVCSIVRKTLKSQKRIDSMIKQMNQQKKIIVEINKPQQILFSLGISFRSLFRFVQSEIVAGNSITLYPCLLRIFLVIVLNTNAIVTDINAQVINRSSLRGISLIYFISITLRFMIGLVNYYFYSISDFSIIKPLYYSSKPIKPRVVWRYLFNYLFITPK